MVLPFTPELKGFSTLSHRDPTALDPQRSYFWDTWELFRCCLLRTLLSYNGRSVERGGTLPKPDLAVAPPTVSADGLTWTFGIRPGLHYAPPMADTEITSPDIVRALEREARIGTGTDAYGFYYSVIQGFDEFASGKVGSISGLETPDPHALVVRLNEPTGDLGFRFTLPATAPIPPSPSDPNATFGTASGHDAGYGRFLVASGPYMIEGSDDLDPSATPKDQPGVSGFEPGRSLTLVRDPSWTRASDPLRPAYASRIKIRIGGTPDRADASVTAGRADLVLYGGPPMQVSTSDIRRYERDPSLGRVVVNDRPFVRYVSINVAAPPFDDVRVRRAVNLVIDKRAIIAAYGGSYAARPAGHIGLDALESDRLIGYDPYRTPHDAGSAIAARREMRHSAYAGTEGVCRDDACRRVAIAVNGLQPGSGQIARTVDHDLRELGIVADIRLYGPGEFFPAIADPSHHIALAVGAGWGYDFPSGSQFFAPLFASTQLAPTGANFALVGATPGELRRWGYATPSVPNVDERLAACERLLGEEQSGCWAELDKYLMEQVVPMVPISFESHVELVPRRVVSYSVDQFTELPALDRVSLATIS